MGTIFRNSKNNQTSETHRLLLNLADKINVKRNDKYVASSNLSMYAQKNIKKSYKNNKFKTSVPTKNKKLDLLDGLYSLSDIQDYFDYIFKKHGEKTDNPLIRIYINKIDNRITYKV